MSVNIRYPNITAASEREQLAQLKSYLHQLVDQLNYALPSMGGSSEQTISVQGEEISYYELRSMIVQELQEVERLFDVLSQKMQSEYVSDEELPKAIEDALAEAKESGEFDGPKGEDGFSPTVTVEEVAGGHKVSIKDATSTQSFVVRDGKDGDGSGGGSGGGLRFELDDGTIYY